eukprot:TRINITY_DN7520_c0_g6_i1.p1 TRINITY_DN7520_c0_g6~~TRINITY_DN7520_c0_g6_i1.p1  ORF type:complete len:307 (-),score=30.91 TRINITY_DN7520_c0_g6_i1:132-1052(-)
MAQDGSKEVEWKGQPFSYLLHHPKPQNQISENYGNVKIKPVVKAATGTWNGPAPTGYGSYSQEATNTQPKQAQQPKSIQLKNGQSLPKIGISIKNPEQQKIYKDAGMIMLIDPDAQKLNGLGFSESMFVCVFISKDFSTNLKQLIDEVAQAISRQQIDLLIVSTEQYDIVGEVSAKGVGVFVNDYNELATLLEKPSMQAPQVCCAQLNPKDPQRQLVGYCIRKSIELIAIEPFGNQRELLNNEIIIGISQKLEKSPQEVLCQWSIGRGQAVILEAPEIDAQHISIFESVFNWSLPIDVKVAIDAVK